MLFTSLLKYSIKNGTIGVIDHRGKLRVFGDRQLPNCTIRLQKPSLNLSLALNPGLYIPEAYMEGDLTIESGSLIDFVDIIAKNYKYVQNFPVLTAMRKLGVGSRKLKQYNPVAIARKNVAHHYDLSSKLYKLFLDRDLQYSCAYFLNPEDDINAAQLNKKRHIAAKLFLNQPGLNILDIGSGWGGLGIYLAQMFSANVVGVTLSKEQFRIANERTKTSGLSDRVNFRLQDYRQVKEQYNRVVSIGMFEHVGKRNYGEFFKKLENILTDDGVAVIHAIGRMDNPSPINPFIRKYIFPGADLPSLSEILPLIEQSQLICTDIEILRIHYAETLRHWREAFNKQRKEIAALYDERFCRMWEVYLLICEMGFRYENLMVFQIQLAKNQNILPLTRNYMYKSSSENSINQDKPSKLSD